MFKSFFQKFVWKYYFILSSCGPLLFLKTFKPSPRYNPMSSLLYLFESWWSKKLPTSSHTSTPSYATIVSSNNPLYFLSMLVDCLKVKTSKKFQFKVFVYLTCTKRYEGHLDLCIQYMFLLELMVALLSLSCYVCWFLISCWACNCS